jgi:hypothetical protein
MVAWQNASSGSWTGFGSIPTYNPPCSQIIAARGNGGNLQIIGRATNSHIVLIAWQNSSGTWTAGADLTPSF